MHAHLQSWGLGHPSKVHTHSLLSASVRYSPFPPPRFEGVYIMCNVTCLGYIIDMELAK